MNNIRIVILSVIIGALFFVYQNMPIASVPLAHAQACTVPTQVTNVSVTFPSCVNNVCNFTQGSCSWATVSGATTFNVVVTEVETSKVVYNQSADAATTSATFPVAESNTYKCDISAVNACGTGATGTSSLLCKVDAAVTTTPTTAPIDTPTTVPVTPKPVMPVTGSNTPLLLMSAVGMIFIIGGIALFRF